MIKKNVTLRLVLNCNRYNNYCKVFAIIKVFVIMLVLLNNPLLFFIFNYIKIFIYNISCGQSGTSLFGDLLTCSFYMCIYCMYQL